MDTSTVEIGQRVSYEDMANPRKVGTVVDVHVGWGRSEFRVLFDDREDTTSDLRQAGWKAVADRHQGTTVELELLAGDPLNPAAGYSVRVLIDGGVASTYAIPEGVARIIMRDAVAVALKGQPAAVLAAADAHLEAAYEDANGAEI